jgi:hypothetical protein
VETTTAAIVETRLTPMTRGVVGDRYLLGRFARRHHECSTTLLLHSVIIVTLCPIFVDYQLAGNTANYQFARFNVHGIGHIASTN